LAAAHGRAMGEDVSGRTRKIQPRHEGVFWPSRICTGRAEELKCFCHTWLLTLSIRLAQRGLTPMHIESAKRCRPQAGEFIPVIDRRRCEGKQDCVTVCPYQVFEMQTLSRTDKNALPFLSRIRAGIHGNHQAFAVRADACQACGLCVKACPERAIKLFRVEIQ
jgi:4Fe-4S ferredoxin